MRATISDIARLANTDRSMVSRVLNNVPNFPVSEKRRRRILDVAKELHFQPHHSARSLATGKSYCIGVVFGSVERDLTSPITACILGAMNQTLLENGYLMSLLPINPGKSLDREVISTIRTGRVDGFFVGTNLIGPETLRELSQCNIPVATLETDSAIVGSGYVSSVQVDLRPAMEAAAQLLARQKHARVACFLPDHLRYYDGGKRFAGFQQALLSQGIQVEEGDFIMYTPAVCEWLYSLQEAFHGATRELSRLLQYSAVFCGSDTVALGLVAALRAKGVEPGRDIALIGYDNIETSPNCPVATPFLTTIDPRNQEQGRWIAKILLERIHNPHEKPRVVTLPAQLIVRKSSFSTRVVAAES